MALPLLGYKAALESAGGRGAQQALVDSRHAGRAGGLLRRPGVLAAGIGEASAFIFEQISLGNRTVDDIDWIKKVLESELTSTVLRKLQEVVGKTDGKMTAKDITGIITGVFLSKKKK